ncbi:MAG: dienelactone hydrolase family protein [Blastocatellia bacterium]
MSGEGKLVELRVGDNQMRGYLAGVEEGTQSPGLILVHEWWGLTDHIRGIADRFVSAGFVVLAPDLYNSKVAKDAEEAGRLMQGLDQQQALATLDAAVSFLKNQPGVRSDRIGVTGFCMGGSFALLLACHSQAIRASAPFYGDVPADDVLKQLSAPVLFIGAELDQWITVDKMERLREAMQRYGKEGEVVIYPGANHAFFNDTRPEVYNREAAEDAWRRVVGFLSEKLA